MTPEELFDNNQRLVYFVVKRIFYTRKTEKIVIEKEDMIQIGMIGLWKACKNFNKDLNIKFSTYAVPTIHGEIANEVRERHMYFRIPRIAKRAFKSIVRRMDNGEEKPSIEEIQEEFQCSRANAEVALDLLYLNFLSINTVVSNEGNSKIYLSDVIADDNAFFENNIVKEEEFREGLIERLSILNDREKLIMELSLAGITQSKIGKTVGLSQVQVSRIYRKALNKIKKYNEVCAHENEPQFT